jgi:hypothetical protein
VAAAAAGRAAALAHRDARRKVDFHASAGDAHLVERPLIDVQLGGVDDLHRRHDAEANLLAAARSTAPRQIGASSNARSIAGGGPAGLE